MTATVTNHPFNPKCARLITLMLKFNVKEKKKRKGSNTEFPSLVVNGRVDKRSFVLGPLGKSDKVFFSADVYDKRVCDYLTNARVNELEPFFSQLTLPFVVDWCDYIHPVMLDFGSRHGVKRQVRKRTEVVFKLQPDVENWAKPYSLSEHSKAFKNAVGELESHTVRYYEDNEFISNGFGIRCQMKGAEAVIKDEINRFADILRKLLERTEMLLQSASRKNAVTAFFTFPPEVKTACEQYLLYFVQFLEDLGVKAKVELKEDARTVLFSVTPMNEATALEQIRQALDIYLHLPGTAGFSETAAAYPDMAVQQLRGNILFLESQITFAKSAMQVKDAAIEQLQLSNYEYRRLLSTEKKKEESIEPLIGDVVHVTDVEVKGFKFALPLFLRRMKRVFGIGNKDTK